MKRYTIPDVAAELDVRPNTVSSYRSRGQMPAPTGYVGRTPWWSPGDIEPWIETQRAHRRHKSSADTLADTVGLTVGLSDRPDADSRPDASSV